jgi:DNA-nicking Smr family endonuclease
MTRRLTPEERRLWHRVARTVRLAPGRVLDAVDEEPAEIVASPPRTAPQQLETHAKSRHHSQPEDLSGQRKIRRGQSEIDARLDLHGHTQDSAHAELVEFLLRQAGQGARCVLVITGKGRMGTGILRTRLFDWISDPELRPFIAGYAPAHPRHGGVGATYVFLRSKR